MVTLLRRKRKFQKNALAMSSDIRVMIIKLCDRTHNMQTLKHLNEQKRNVLHKKQQISMRQLQIDWDLIKYIKS